VSWPHVLTPRVGVRCKGARLGAGCLLALLSAMALAVSSLSPALAQKASSTSTPVLPGGDSKEPINIDAAKLDYFDKEQKLIYTGDVIATQGDSTLKATALVLYLTPKNSGDQTGVPASSSQLRRMEATGPVTLVTKGQVGTGDAGVYEKGPNTLYLIGNVTLTQGTSVTKGDKLTYDLTSGQAVVTGHVRSLFIPDNGPNNGADGGAQAGAKAAGSGAPTHKKPAKATP
jgi:lipopolysaccharide export system protein LptA